MRIVRVFLLLAAGPLCAGPQGGTVADGTAAISVAGKVTTIDQSTAKAIINWQRFESTPTETIRFNQPSTSALTLNRVVGVDPSFIGGPLQANGGLFIINPNGIVFGPNAQVNVGSLVASSLNITDADFKNGNFQFLQGAGELSSVINRGSITASEGGTVALLAPIVDNSGTIVAAAGRVIVRAGVAAGIDVDAPELPHPPDEPAPTADGRNVRMATIGLTPVLEDVVNTQSISTATKVTRLSDGTVFLRGAGGIFVNGGTIDVSKAGGTSGSIQVDADHGIGYGAGSRMLAGTTGGGGQIGLTAFQQGYSRPAGTSGRAVIEADSIFTGAFGDGVRGDAGGSLEFRGGRLDAQGFAFGGEGTPVRVNTQRFYTDNLGPIHVVSDGDLTIDFAFALGGTLRVAGSIFAGQGDTTHMGFEDDVEVPLVHIFGFEEVAAGHAIGTPIAKVVFASEGIRTAPDGVNAIDVTPTSLVAPPLVAGTSVDDSLPAPRANYTPPFDGAPAADAGPITVTGGATVNLATSTGGGSIVVSSGSSSGSVGTPDNVLVSSSRSSTARQSADGPSGGPDDVVVVKNDEPGDSEEETAERKKKSSPRAND